MPGLMPMRSFGVASSKARSGGGLARVKAGTAREEAATQLVRVPTQKSMGLLSAQFAASRTAKAGAEFKLFGNEESNRYVSSGSEHEVNSVCLGAMVDGFIEDDGVESECGRSRCNCQMSGTSLCDCSDAEDSRSSLGGELSEILQEFFLSSTPTERILLGEVSKADAGGIRHVMKALRAGGYNAAICKSRWDHAGSFPGGDYEYIDVVFEGATGRSERVVIDIDFRAQFEIARPTACYHAVVQSLPTVFIGKADRLLQVVNIMSDAVKMSLKKRGMPLPPWRKPEYMRAKWFSSYRRTTNDAGHTPQQDHAAAANLSRLGAWDAKHFTDEMEVGYLRVMKKPEAAAAAVAAPTKVVVDNSVWTPPALKPRVFQRPGQAGLASILREAGLTSKTLAAV